jgi:dipeptidase E
MRLYLSSFRVGDSPQALLRLLGKGRHTAVIGNACDALSTEDRIDSTRQELDRLTVIGLEPEELDLRDFFDAEPAAVLGAMSRFDLVWLRGGNVFVLRRAFRQSGADVALAMMLQANSVVYGGYSAGVCVLTPSLRGIELVDDPSVVPLGYDPTIIWDGLNVLPYAVAPHYESDHPESAAIGGLVARYMEQNIPFKALRDGQVIVVDGESDELLG